MLKKLFVTAAAAAAMSVPLAGVAWAEPPSDTSSNDTGTSSNDTGIGAGGVPEKAGNFLDNYGLNPNGDGNPAPPGSVFKGSAQGAGNTPDAYGDALNGFWHGQGQFTDTDFNPTPPGMASKAFTPACSSGRTAGGVGGCF
jgi:hypothetical protein